MRGRLVGSLLSVAWLACACGGPQEPGGEGADCYRDRDCQAGLVCVGPAQGRKCSSDVSTLVSAGMGPPAPEDAGYPEDAATTDPEDAGATTDPDAG